ncbi:unnamed protein product, partial [Didymodactylos carnosus]
QTDGEQENLIKQLTNETIETAIKIKQLSETTV